MNKDQHYQGFIHVCSHGASVLRDSDGRWIADARSMIGSQGRDNARRLAACWNVCDGMSTDSLENMLMLDATMSSRFTELKADAAHADASAIEANYDAARKLLAAVIENENAVVFGPDVPHHDVSYRIRDFLKGGA